MCVYESKVLNCQRCQKMLLQEKCEHMLKTPTVCCVPTML